MSAITNFNPVKSINSLLQPLGMTLSNKQQIINKLAFATFAILAINYGLTAVDAGSVIRDVNRSDDLEDCLTNVCDHIGDEAQDLRDRCYRACQRRFS